MTTSDFLSSLVPHMFKSQFDDKATDFLRENCPEALSHPMPVPIEQIAKEKLHLDIKELHLTEDLSILGQMCFTDGLVEIYDPDEDEYREILVKAGTMIIDPDTYLKRNLGTKRNTIAHECVHWIYHRRYYQAISVIEKDLAVAHRCPVEIKDEKFNEKWTDEDWMEWQANGIAPRILIPKQTVEEAYDMIKKQSEQNAFVSAGLLPQNKWIVEQFAGFYQVSKQSAVIRLQELGYLS